MEQEIAEQAAPEKLEAILSGQVEEVSEEPAAEEVEEAEKSEEEATDDVESRIQAEADKRANKYREIRETDTALIRKQSEQIRELQKQTTERGTNKLIASILSGDEDAGFTEEETKGRETALKEFAKKHTDYTSKSLEIEETAQYISDMADKLPSKVVKGFGLDDSNPIVRAKNGVEFLNETASVYNHNQNFLLAVEEFLPKGDELRTKLETLVEGMAEFESEKSKKLYLADQLKGLKVTPRKAPKAPSAGSGGEDLSKLTGRQLMERGFKGKV